MVQRNKNVYTSFEQNHSPINYLCREVNLRFKIIKSLIFLRKLMLRINLFKKDKQFILMHFFFLKILSKKINWNFLW